MRLRIVAIFGAMAMLVGACSGGDAPDEAVAGGADEARQAEGTPPATIDSATGTETTTETNTDGGTETGTDTDDPPGADGGNDGGTDQDNGDGGDGSQDDAEEPAEPDPAPTGPVLVPVTDGDSGDDVLALQTRLDELGFSPGTPDGDYGRRTLAAVEAFQSLAGLETTGIADAETIRAISQYRYDGMLVRRGDEGTEVEQLQLRLGEGPFDPGVVDGKYGTATTQAVWALEKLAGIPVDGDWGPLDEDAWERLMSAEIGRPEKDHEMRWVEVDLSQQLMKVYDPASSIPTLVSHASSGSGIPWENEDHRGSSITPVGDFEIDRRIDGWRESSLDIGRLYNPLYFVGGIALHGAASVPLYPASHGCVRLPMHVAEYLPDELPNGTPVHVVT